MAAPLFNPWANEATPEVKIEVNPIGEVWSDLGTNQYRNHAAIPNLRITNAAGIIPAAGKAADTVSHFANVDYVVSVDLGTTNSIPNWTRFHILWNISNRAAYTSVGAGFPGAIEAVASTIVTYRRDAGGYIGTTPGTPVAVQSAGASASATPTPVDYAADAIHGLPSVGTSLPIEVIYTIASQ